MPARERRADDADDEVLRDLIPRDEPVEIAEEAAKADKDWAGNKRLAAGEALALAPVRVFPAPVYRGDETGPRTDFRQTIHWAPTVRTGKDGGATVTFYLSDAVTSFRVFAEGAGGGQIGRTEKVIASSLPFSMAVKLPLEVSQGDTIELPLTLTNEQPESLKVALEASFGALLTPTGEVALPDGALAAKARSSLYYPVKVTGTQGKSAVSFKADAGGLADAFDREVLVTPLGFPQLEERAGTLSDTVLTEIDLGDADPATVAGSIKLYPSPVSTLVGGLDGLIRQPSGCFEQTSSSNYPNVMVLKYLQAHEVADPALIARTQQLLDQGYKRLVGYETKDQGYEWFGSTPPHEALTAYGVLEFVDMKGVYGGVDDAMIARTVAFLKGRRDGKGGFKQDSKALDSFGRASAQVADAYIMYAISQAGLTAGFEPELEKSAALARETRDPYLLALASSTLTGLPSRAGEAKAAVDRLAGLQGADGRWTGADHSITRSTGVNLDIETTALAMMALMKVGGHEDRVRTAVEWLQKNRSGFGQWGATQATVLALEAMTDYAVASRATPSDGSVTLVVNGEAVDTFNYAAGRREPIEFTAFSKHFRAGKNTVELRHKGEAKLPYSIAVEFRAKNPATAPDVTVGVTTALARDTVKMGENVRLTAVVENRTAQGQPMTLARVGLPGGLTFQTWQLKELKDKGIIAFYETRPREVILYFRDLAPSARVEVPIDLVALVPGHFTAPASSAYLYYGDDKKFWAPGLEVTVAR
ncbi:MAG: alpha-2-macroglobulin family protein [bacterium]